MHFEKKNQGEGEGVCVWEVGRGGRASSRENVGYEGMSYNRTMGKGDKGMNIRCKYMNC